MSPSTPTRTELDSLGELEVPAEAYCGIQTARAIRNFPISGWAPFPKPVTATVQIKKAAAIANSRLAGSTPGSPAPSGPPPARFSMGACVTSSWSIHFKPAPEPRITADQERCLWYVEHSAALVTALNPKIGYSRAAEIAKRAIAEGKTIREAIVEN